MTNIDPVSMDDDTADSGDPAMQPRRRGRPPKNAVREPVRTNNRGGVIVQGRDGQPLTRSVASNRGDPFYIDPKDVPPGWEYQWNIVTIINDAETARQHSIEMYQQGWRPVPANRYPGRWMPHGHEGDITFKGMRLEERPKELSDEARREDYRNATQQMRDRDQALMGGKANAVRNMPHGFAMDAGRYRGTGGRLQMSIDPALDVPAPHYDLATGEE